MLHPRNWKDDNSAEQCSRCATAFTLLRRRHHCRHCGDVFCGPCTSQRLWLRPWLGATSTLSGVVLPADSGSGARDGVAEVSGESSAAHTPRHTHSESLLSEVSKHSNMSNEGGTKQLPSTASAMRRAEASADTRQAVSITQNPRPPTSSPATPAATAVAAAACTPFTTDMTVHRSPGNIAEGSGGSTVGLTSSSVEAESRDVDGTTTRSQEASDCFVSLPTPVSASTSAAAAPITPVTPQPPQLRTPVNALVSVAVTPANASVKREESAQPLPRPFSTGAVSASTVNSRQLSDALFTGSLYAISPTTVTGDVTPQTLASPVPAFERATSRDATFSTGSADVALDATPRAKSENECASLTVPAPQVTAARMNARSSPLTSDHHHRTATTTAGAGVDTAAYAEASYRTEVDQRGVVWYLCRVCRGCYGTLLDAILDAHEHSPLLFQPQQRPPQAATAFAANVNPTLPLWQYVRLCSSTKTQHTRSSRDVVPQQQQQQKLALAARSASTTAQMSLSSPTVTRPLLSSAWARLRASVSFPASPVTSSMRAASPTPTPTPTTSVTAATHPGGGASSLLPPALRPCDLRRTRASPSTAHALSRATAAPASKAVPPTMGVPGLPARLYGPTATTTAMAAASRSGYSSPASVGHPAEASVLSVSSISLPLTSRQPTEVTSPRQTQQQQQQRTTRPAVTPPRRRLISIDNSTSHIRQAVAIARRRRRIAIILIDEREAEKEPAGVMTSHDDAALLGDAQEESVGRERRGRGRSMLADGSGAEAGVISFSSNGSPVCPDDDAVYDFDVASADQPMQPGRPASPSAPIATPVAPALTREQESSFGDSPTTQRGDARRDRPCNSNNNNFNSTGAVTARGSGAGPRVNLSIVVNSEGEESDAALEGQDGAAMRDLEAADWLRPTLPVAAAVASPMNGSDNFNNNSLSVAAYAADWVNDVASPNTVSRVTYVREALSMPSDPTLAVTSRPISCVGGGAASGSASTPKHSPIAAATGHQHHRTLPAILISPECGSCVLNALFRELGAVTHRSTVPATPVFSALTPTAAAAAAAAAASGAGLFPALSAGPGNAGALLVDPMFAGGVPQSGWGTGPESYAAQRQALVREMVLRQQRAAMMAAAAATGSAASPAVSPAAGGYALANNPPLGSSSATATSGNYNSSNSNNAVNNTAFAAATPSTHERVTAPVNVFFQLRSPTDATVVLPTPTTATTAAASTATGGLSISILPVSTQVEMIGIPIDVSASPGSASPQTVPSPTNGFTSPRNMPTNNNNNNNNGNNSVCSPPNGLGMAGVTRLFTLSELLPQLAKLSTNMDGYVIVVLRCGIRRSRTDSISNTTTSPMVHAACLEESPHLSASRRARCNSLSGAAASETTVQLARPSLNYAADPHASSVRLAEENSVNSCSASYTFGNATSLSGPPPTTNTTAAAAAAATRTRDRIGSVGDLGNVRRRHRVTEPFGRSQLRSLYQQLQSCGVTQPAVSVVDVCEDYSSRCNGNNTNIVTSDVEESPGSAASPGSPFHDRATKPYDSIVSNGNGNNTSLSNRPPQPASPVEAWRGSPSSPMNVGLSPAVASPVSPHSSSVRLLVPALQKAATLSEGVTRRPERPEKLEEMMLPSSLHSTRERLASTDFASPTTAAAAAAVATMESNNNKHELRHLAAQEHAMNSLRTASHQLGLPFSNAFYSANETEQRLDASSGGGNTISADPPLRTGHAATAGGKNAGNGGAVVNNALLSRGLESLLATMVYRDLSAQQ